MLTIAIQKSGRLNEQSLKLLKDCGMQFSNGLAAKLTVKCTNFPLQILFLRDDDIAEALGDGVADAGIVGQNVVREQQANLPQVRALGFARCRMSLAVPKSFQYQSTKDLQDRSIATSYPQILNTFLQEKGVQATIRTISGSVEIAPGIGMADAIFDIVSSGSTLLANGLREVETVLESEAVLLQARRLPSAKQQLLQRLDFRIAAVQKAARVKYILLNAPNDQLDKICAILPGMKSPTVMPLAENDWSSVHSVIEEDAFWEHIEQLKQAGAQGILTFPVEKMIL